MILISSEVLFMIDPDMMLSREDVTKVAEMITPLIYRKLNSMSALLLPVSLTEISEIDSEP